MKRFLLRVNLCLAILLSITRVSDAQTKFFQCKYLARYVSNGFHMELVMDGKGNSMYEKFGHFFEDSLFAVGKWSEADWKKRQYENGIFIGTENRGSHGYMVQKNIGKGLTLIGLIAKNYYTYTEPDTLFHWKLLDNTDSVVAGYHSHKAQCKIDGMIWTAWYTQEIPISDGPYKFTGLPGLITTVYNATGMLRIELAYFLQKELKIPVLDRRDDIPIAKYSYIKHKKDFMDNFLEYMNGSGNFAIGKNREGETIEQQWAKRPIGMDELF